MGDLIKDNKKVLVVADLHLDHWLAAGRDPFDGVDCEALASLDALIIAGDLSNKPKIRWPKMLRHIGRYVPIERVYVIPGNHDYYDHVLDGDKRLEQICGSSRANFAQKRELVNGDTRYLCCTLWTDFALDGSKEADMSSAAAKMNDYRYIRMERARYRKIHPIDVVHVHSDQLAWLRARLAEKFDGRTIVVSHHAPLPDCVTPRASLAPAYASDLSELIDTYKPDTWLYGHTHKPRLLKRGKTEVRCVSIGYPHECPSEIMLNLWNHL